MSMSSSCNGTDFIKIIYTKPKREKEVQDALESLFIGANLEEFHT